MTEPTEPPTGPSAAESRGDAPRAEAPKWVPLAGLAGLLLTLLFTTWYMDTEPPHRWKDAAVDAAIDAGPDGGAVDQGP